MTSIARASALALAVSIALSTAVSSASPLSVSPFSSAKPNVSDAIIGGDTDAIIGGDTDAIIGGDILDAIPPNLLIWGPIESVDPAKKTVVVLGQRLKANAGGSVLQDLQMSLQIGHVSSVAISGRLKSNGQLDSATMQILDKPYVAGSDFVFVTGKVKSVDGARAKVTVGGLKIDYSQLLSASSVQIEVGDLLTVAGTQPVLQGEVYAQAMRVDRQTH
jgi:hypothetical protein